MLLRRRPPPAAAVQLLLERTHNGTPWSFPEPVSIGHSYRRNRVHRARPGGRGAAYAGCVTSQGNTGPRRAASRPGPPFPPGRAARCYGRPPTPMSWRSRRLAGRSSPSARSMIGSSRRARPRGTNAKHPRESRPAPARPNCPNAGPRCGRRRLQTAADLRDLYGFLIEPAYRRGSTLLDRHRRGSRRSRAGQVRRSHRLPVDAGAPSLRCGPIPSRAAVGRPAAAHADRGAAVRGDARSRPRARRPVRHRPVPRGLRVPGRAPCRRVRRPPVARPRPRSPSATRRYAARGGSRSTSPDPRSPSMPRAAPLECTTRSGSAVRARKASSR